MIREAESGAETGRILCRVFLCHNSADKPFVKEIADRLELDFGVLHFLDVFDIPTGEAFRVWIEHSLRDSTGCAIFLGANGWGPTHLWEAQMAIKRNATDTTFRLIPVALPGIREEDMAALDSGNVFRDLNWADFRNGVDDLDALDKLYASVTGSVLSEGRGPARLTPYQVRRDAARWTKSGQRETSVLYRGAQLEEAEQLTRTVPDLAAKTEIGPFLVASARRQRLIWRRVALIAITVALIVIGLGVTAEILRETAEQRRILALSRSLVIQSRTESAPAVALLLAAQAFKEAETPDTTANLFERLQGWSYLKRLLYGNGTAITRVVSGAEGNSITAGSSDGYLFRWSAKNEHNGAPLRASVGSITSLTAASNPPHLWAGYEDGRVLRWDNEGHRIQVEGIPPGLDLRQIADVNKLGLGPRIGAIALSPNGSLAAVGTAQGTGSALVFFVDQRTGTTLGSPVSVGVPRVNALDFDQNSSTVVAGTGFGVVLTIDVRRRMAIALNGPRLSEILSVRFSHSGSLIAVSDIGEVAIWKNQGSSYRLANSFKTTDLLTSAAIKLDGRTIALGDANGMVYLFSVQTHQRIRSFRAHVGAVNSLAWDDGMGLITGGADGAIGVWNFESTSPLVVPQGRVKPRVVALQLRNDGLLVGRISLGSADVCLENGSECKVIRDLYKDATRLLGSSRLKKLSAAAPQTDGFVPVPSPEIDQIKIDAAGQHVIWSTSDGAVLSSPLSANASPFVVHDDAIKGNASDVSLSQTGHFVAVAYKSRLLLFDLLNSTGKPIAIKSSTASESAQSLAFNSTETLLAAGFENGSIALWSVPDARLIAQQQIHNSPAGNVTFSATGKYLFSNAVVGDGNETALVAAPVPSLTPGLRLIAGASGEPPALIEASGTLIATIDNQARIDYWDAKKLQPIGTANTLQLPVTAATLSSATNRLYVADEDGWIRALTVGGNQWLAIACAVVGRSLSRDEWAQFLPGERYAPACSGRPD